MKRLAKKMEHWLVMVLLVLVGAVLSGCAERGAVSLDTSLGGVETASDDMGRFSAWAKVETAKASALKAIGTARKAPAAATATENITVVLDTPEKIQQWTQLKTTEALSRAVEKLAEGQKPDTIAANLQPSPMPKGVVAETIDSAGQAVEKVAHTPTAVASSVGIAAVQIGRAAIAGAGDKTTVNGEANQVSKTTNQVITSAKGQSVATGASAGDAQVVPFSEEESPGEAESQLEPTEAIQQ